MSLQVWLPLTKDLRQQGLSRATVNGGIISNNGKLGQCYLVNSSNPINITHSLATTTEFSFAFWMKIPTNMGTNTGWEQMIRFNAINVAGGSTSTTAINWANYQAVKIYDDAKHQWLWAYPGTNFSYDKWHHWSITHTANGDGVTGKIYIDGILIGTYNNTTDPLKLVSGTISFGTSVSVGDGFYLNDVRIYDHCLSPMEVKELAKGLVLHYPLNRQGWGQENLLSRYVVPGQAGPTSTSAGGRTTWLGDYKITIPATENADTYFRLFTTKQLTANATYTISCQVSGLKEGSSYNFPLYAQNNTGMGVLQLNHNGLCSLTFTMTYGTQTAATGANGETVYICFMDDSGRSIASGQGAITVSNFKLEEGSIVTPWCPNSSDTLATTMGLNSTTEYDCSGFCNNGIRTGTFTWTSNTPKYAVSQVFNGTNNAIQTPSLPTMITDKNYTIAVWIYKTAIGSKNYQTIYGGPSGFELEARNGTTTEAKFVGWNWGKPAAAYEFNKWNHCVFVHSDDDCKVYLNGEYVATGTAKASNPSGNYFVGAWNTATQQNFEGLMSDFRIYATALSADDVKSLYQNSAYIDSSGNVYGAVHSEV